MTLSAPPIRSLMILDERKLFSGTERRRMECRRLHWCEERWIEESGSAQARCPEDCEGFVQRPNETR